MDAAPILQPVPEAEQVPPRRDGLRARLSRLVDLLIGRVSTLVLAAVALALGVATFVFLATGVQRPNQLFALILANLVVVLLLVALLSVRLTRVWMERRRAAAGARLHVRLVLLFSVVAVTPAIVVAVFSTIFFNYGIQAWFADPVRTALQQSLSAARGYAEEHRNNIRADALSMSADLVRGGLRLMSTDPNGFLNFLATQTGLRGLTESAIYEPVTGQVIASAGSMTGFESVVPPEWATEMARTGEVAVLGSEDQTKVRGVVLLETTPNLMLVIGRLVDPSILDHIVRTEKAVQLYERLDQNRTGLQVTFAVVFALVALAVLAAGWPRVVEEERVRHTAATLVHVQRAGVAAEWNRRSRPVAVLGAPGMGYGFNVLPFLRRSVEGRAMHATSEEIRGACRRTKWKQGVCWAWSVVLYVYCV